MTKAEQYRRLARELHFVAWDPTRSVHRQLAESREVPAENEGHESLARAHTHDLLAERAGHAALKERQRPGRFKRRRVRLRHGALAWYPPFLTSGNGCPAPWVTKAS